MQKSNSGNIRKKVRIVFKFLISYVYIQNNKIKIIYNIINFLSLELETYPHIESAFFDLESSLENNICRENVCTSDKSAKGK